ncbi:MAG: RNA polymerase sigma factor SigZ [Ignavibacteriae bacterium]|nr:RNA polymerase sigma factor SigZ [Ignavibacteriota bacterium]
MATKAENLEHLYKQFSKRLLNFIVQRVNSRDEAEDILHDVFLKVHANIESLNDSMKIESWLYQITRNAIIDYYRTRKPKETLPENIVEEEETESAMERLTPSINHFIEQLPEPYREAITLTELQGMKQKDLATKLGISHSGAKSRVQRARKMLKDLFFECCHFEFDRYGTVIDYHPISCCCCGLACENNC